MLARTRVVKPWLVRNTAGLFLTLICFLVGPAASQGQGPVAGNTNPQALWVFSSDACGTYGMENLKISHAGRTNPVGIISLASDNSKLRIPNGTAMLLRVNAVSRD